ncbi:hypothetical protein ACN47E_002757 [Coniothyrium glycines]
MRSSIFVSAAVVAVASAQSSSIDPFPQTNLLAQTNSLGVVTGMFSVATNVGQNPAVVTSQPSLVTEQPAVVTNQPVPADIPAVGPGVHTLVLAGTGSAFNSTRTVTVSADSSTTLLLVPATSSAIASGSGVTRASGSGSGSPTASGAGQPSTGAAVPVKAAAGGLAGLGAIVAAFL